MAISRPIVLIPNVAEPSKWAVIACDQFTGQPEYWEQLTEHIGDAPSALNFVLPEVWLGDKLIEAPAEIAAAMQTSLANGHFDELAGFILVERTLSSGVKRLGLIAAIDLNEYEYTENSQAKIRATEKTVEERLPARVTVRENAPLETPHTILFINDPDQGVIERLYANKAEYQMVYDFELNMGGGHLRGWLIPDDRVTAELLALEKDGLLAVVGDGNHSVAAAKLAGDLQTLVEIVNIHSEAIEFEPIHRVILGAGYPLIDALSAHLSKSVEPGQAEVAETKVYHQGSTVYLPIPPNPADAVADIQDFLDQYAANQPEIEIDYIHGADHLIAIADRENGVAVFLPALAKAGLFDFVAKKGVLPRKAFSVGAPQDKRYYFEAAARLQPRA